MIDVCTNKQVTRSTARNLLSSIVDASDEIDIDPELTSEKLSVPLSKKEKAAAKKRAQRAKKAKKIL